MNARLDVQASGRSLLCNPRFGDDQSNDDGDDDDDD